MPKLKLAYPDRDPDIGSACDAIKRQLAAIGLEIELVLIEPQLFYDQVVVGRKFDLAYWRHDFDDEAYWLWPLFDPQDRGKAGSNFMHVNPDPTLETLFLKVGRHKQFAKIRDATHKIHDHIAKNAIVISLWQLNPYVAVSRDLENLPQRLDPIYLFSGIESWKLKPALRERHHLCGQFCLLLLASLTQPPAKWRLQARRRPPVRQLQRLRSAITIALRIARNPLLTPLFAEAVRRQVQDQLATLLGPSRAARGDVGALADRLL